ncbi:MAG: hypothetical protein J07HX64_01036 [halophilic archaeon J07HX64]|nr:MAG: hypothetical protein J07HX64_01036 [halophilic archaeon J07HX64]
MWHRSVDAGTEMLFRSTVVPDTRDRRRGVRRGVTDRNPTRTRCSRRSMTGLLVESVFTATRRLVIFHPLDRQRI